MRRNNTNIWKKGILTAFAALFFSVLFSGTSQAAVGINQQISFQGKLVTSSGANIADGTYNLQFKIYQDGNSTGGGTLLWTENHLVNASQGVAVSAGTFQVNLGSRNAFASQVDWNQDTLYLSMNVGGTGTTAVWDGEMSPFIRLTSVPYALNAGMVGGLTASQLVQLQSGSPGTAQTGNINVSGTIIGGGLRASTLDTASAGVLTVGSGNATGITLSKNVTITSGQTLTAGGNTVLSGTGILQSAAFSGTYSNAVTLSSTSNSIAGTFTGSVTGSYAGSVIAAQYGGTGLSSYAVGDLLTATGTTTIAKLSAGASGTCLKSTGTGANLTYGTCYSATMQAAYDGGNTITQTAAGTLTLTSGTTVPTADQFVIDNTASSGVTTAGVNAANIKYKGGAAAIEGSGLRIDYTPGTTTGGDWNGIRVAPTAGATSGVDSIGVKIDNSPVSSGGTNTGIYVGSGWDIGLNLASGGLQLSSQADPSTSPATDTLRIYAKTIAGRVMPKWIGPSGVDTPMQANFGFNRIAMMAPSGVATSPSATNIMNMWGNTSTNSASSYTQATLANSNLSTATRQVRLSGTATSGTTVYSTPQSLMAWRGNAAGIGGFFFTTRFSFSTLGSAPRAFIGLTDALTTPSNVDPTTATTPGRLGIAVNSATGNLKWISNTSGTAPTSGGTDLGATNFAVNTTNLYELVIFSAPFSDTVTYRVKNLNNNTTTGDVTVSTNLPTKTTAFLAPQFWMSTNAASAIAIQSGGWYLESDN